MIGKFRYVDALKYPYRHYINTMLIPGAIVYVEMVCWYVLIIAVVFAVVLLVVGVAGSASHLNSALHQLPFFAASGDNPVLMLAEADSGSGGDFDWGSISPSNFNFNFGSSAGPIYYLLWCGFEWRLYGHWKEHGLEAEPPAWVENFPGIIRDGFKVATFYALLRLLIGSIVVFPLILFAATNWEALVASFNELAQAVKSDSAPPEWLLSAILFFAGFFVLFALVDFFMAPFFIAPLIHSSTDRTLANLSDWDKTMATGSAHYTDVIIAFLLIGVTAVIYTVGGVIMALATCCIGFLLFPFLFMGAFRTTAAHLLAQAYDLGVNTSAPDNTPPENKTVEK